MSADAPPDRSPPLPPKFDKRGGAAAALRLRNRRRLAGVRGFSSTGSPVNTDSTITEPKVPELIRSCAGFLQEHIIQADKQEELASGEGIFDVFNEVYHPLTRLSKHALKMETSVDGISEFVNQIYEAGRLQPEPVVMAVAYIRRLLAEKGLKITRLNYRRLILGCLVLASKVWEDFAVWNIDFIDVCPSSSSQDQANLERELLKMLSYDVSLDGSEYARVYYDLRAASRYGKFRELSPLKANEQDKFTAKINKAQAHLSATTVAPPRSKPEDFDSSSDSSDDESTTSSSSSEEETDSNAYCTSSDATF